MSTLHIHLFGSMDLRRDLQLLPSFPTQKARNLFAYLVLHRERLHPREVLVGIFWGDRPEPVARKCLRTDLWRVRAHLERVEPGSSPPLVVEGGEVGFDTAGDYWLDVEEFERRVSAAASSVNGTPDPAEAQLLQEAVDLYRSDLLDGIYEDWCLYDRERLRLLYLSILERLMRYYKAREEWEAAIRIGRRLLSLDPLLETVHRELMRCYYQQGNRPAALRQYSDCVAVLDQELEVAPMEETSALYQEMRATRPPAGARASEPFAPTEVLARAMRVLETVDDTLAQLRTATRQLEDARVRLRQRIGLRGKSGSQDRRETFL